MTSTAQPVKIRKPLGDRILTVVCYTIAIVFAICCLIPFIMALSTLSVTWPTAPWQEACCPSSRMPLKP